MNDDVQNIVVNSKVLNAEDWSDSSFLGFPHPHFDVGKVRVFLLPPPGPKVGAGVMIPLLTTHPSQ